MLPSKYNVVYIECVFGILKKRFVILKAFNQMAKVQNIDNVFVSCCFLHNILLEADGFLDIDLPDVAFGLRNKLKSETEEMVCG
jgi:hypothetical protein